MRRTSRSGPSPPWAAPTAPVSTCASTKTASSTSSRQQPAQPRRTRLVPHRRRLRRPGFSRLRQSPRRGRQARRYFRYPGTTGDGSRRPRQPFPDLQASSPNVATRWSGRVRDWTNLASPTGDAIGVGEAARRAGRIASDIGLTAIDELAEERAVRGWQTKAGLDGGTLLIGHLDVPTTSRFPPSSSAANRSGSSARASAPRGRRS